MPPIKQTTTGSTVPRPKQGGVLGRIAPVKRSNVGRFKFSLYGTPKTGKTRFACTFPKPLLLIGAEDGTASVVGTKGVDFVQLEHSNEMFEIIEALKTGKYASVVLDTATKLRDLRLAEITGNRNVMVQKSFGIAGRDQYMQLASNMKDMLAPLLDLPRVMPLNVVIIAQEQNLTAEGVGGGDSELIRPQIGSAVGKSVSDFINAECDYICQTLIREQTTERKVKVGAMEKIVTEKTGKKEYCIRIGPHEVYTTGFRIGMERRDDIPDFIVSPTYDKVVELIEGK